VTRALADTSVFVATETGRPVGPLPDALAISVVTLAELELGVLRAADAAIRARRRATLNRVRADMPAVPITERIATVFAGLVAEMREAGHRVQVHDTWIAATAVSLGVAVCTQDDDFEAIPRVEVMRV
jgi:predicted nucleic acid-binding protein